jgi:hypothetical protein
VSREVRPSFISDVKIQTITSCYKKRYNEAASKEQETPLTHSTLVTGNKPVTRKEDENDKEHDRNDRCLKYGLLSERMAQRNH